MARHPRNLIALGNTSLAVGIPKEIVEALGLRKGGDVYISLDSEKGRIVIDQKQRSTRRKRAPNGYWDKKENRVMAVRALLKKFKKGPNEIRREDFISSGLGGGLLGYYNGSIIAALAEAGYSVSYGPGKRRHPQGYWASKENRVDAVREMVKELRMSPSEIGCREFEKAGLSTVLHHHGGSALAALEEAGYRFARYGPEKVKNAPKGYWRHKKRRIEAIKWLIAHTEKSPEELGDRDFRRAGLRGLLSYYGSSRMALRDAGYDLPLRTRAPTGYWESREHRVKAIRRMVQLTGNRPEKITLKTFTAFHLSGLLGFYHTSISKALKDAGYKPEQSTKISSRLWSARETRIETIRGLVQSSGKHPGEITWEDFYNAGIMRVITRYRSVEDALRDAGVVPLPPLRKKTPTGDWEKKEDRIAATKWLVKRLGGNHFALTHRDFKEHGLEELIRAYDRDKCAAYERGDIFTHDPGYLLAFSSRVTRALVEAGFEVEQRGEAPLHTGRLQGFWKMREHRVAAIKRLVEDVGGPKNLRRRHFIDHQIEGILSYYKGSVRDALRDVGYDLHPWEQSVIPCLIWRSKEDRVAATRWLASRRGGDPRYLRYTDFKEEGLEGLVRYAGGVLAAVREAGFDINPWERPRTPARSWNKRENRAAAVRWLAARTMKNRADLTPDDFAAYGLGYLLDRYGMKQLLDEAGRY
ncbi:MAG: AbrB/MazE/SpoVT family DNA-binding domain-containing protein [Candidatus Thermoplasmatota archaeon]